MTIRFFPRGAPRAIGLGLLLAAGTAGLAFADAAAPVPNKGDTAWMLTSTALVLMMSIPGLALFYGGMVRKKNMASILSQVFAIVALVSIVWVLYGYSLAFTEGSHQLVPFAAGDHPWLGFLQGYEWNNLVGGLDRAFLKGITPDSNVPTFSNGIVIPEYVYMAFQMTFAIITPALIIGGFAERMKFSAVFVFILLWVTFIYFPIAHGVWYWAGPDAIADAAKALADAPDDAAKEVAQANLDAVLNNAGFFNKMGALDFAGGTVVHINAGIAGFVGCLFLGKRIGYPHDIEPPHSITMSMIGASLLWVGWFGFNAGSNLEFEWHDSARFREHLCGDRGRDTRLDVHRMAGQGQAISAWHDLGRRRGPCRDHPGIRLCRSDGINRSWLGGRCDLLHLLRIREAESRL